MSPNRGWFACLAVAVAVLAAPALRAEEPKKELTGDLKEIQGTWVSKDDTGESTWKFEGNSLLLKVPGREYDIAIKLDPEAKPEKALDFDVKQDSPNASGFKAPGIYKFDGKDKLVICFGVEGQRPKEFKGDFQTSFLFEMTRKK